MAPSLRDRSAPTLRWWVQRNPAYVLSAACIACGARMLLVPSEKPPAGDVVLMLTTLGVLQAYEMLVTSILIALRRSIRAPEDQPSILIIGTIFWTGPLIATMEMTAARPMLGFALALGVCIVAIGEMLTVARTFGWRLARTTPVMAATFLLIVATAQPLLRVDASGSGTDEVLLYALWWLVALTALATIPGLRHAGNSKIDAGIVAAAIGAAMLHLYAMNHAFVGHARAFYAAPALAAAAAAGMCVLRPGTNGRSGWWFMLFFWLPFIGICLSFDRFDSAVTLTAIPPILHDPLLVALVLAACVWWWGYTRHRWEPLQHAAALALVYASIRLFFLDPSPVGVSTSRMLANIVSRGEWGGALVATAWYLAVQAWWRQSRGFAAVALILHQFGLSSLLPAAWPLTDLVRTMTWGWTALLVFHVASRDVVLFWRLLPIAYLVIASWVYVADAQSPDVEFYAKLHCGFIVVVLAAAGWAVPWTRYRTVAVVVALLDVSPYAVHWTRHHPHGPATAVIIAGFGLLAGAALISWHKQALLARIAPRLDAPIDAETVGEPRAG